jgi:vacuolar iron transporter family protein
MGKAVWVGLFPDKKGFAMTVALISPRLRRSLLDSAGTIVFGMEDGTVSIFGLIFGVAATTSSSNAVLVAGAAGAAAAAVSMMAGAYLDAETSQDEMNADLARLRADMALDPASMAALLPERLAASGLTPGLSIALTNAVGHDPDALRGLLSALQAPPKPPPNPLVQALWMLIADFLSAAIPILPFFFLPVPQARYVAAAATITLLVGLGAGRARIGGRSMARTVMETVTIGIAAAVAGVAIGLLINHSTTG